MHRNTLYILVFIFLWKPAFSQEIKPDTVHQLREVTITESRFRNFTTGKKIEETDTAIVKNFSANNLSDLLVQQSRIFIKSYGLGNLSTTSLRGAGAAHTAVLWNGFNLQNPMNGVVDLSLIPVAFADDILLQPGGSGALFGSGAVGGTLHLNNVAEFDKGISAIVNNGFGSFSNYHQNVGLQVSKEKFITSTRLFHHIAKNNFTFINTSETGNPEVKQSNNELQQYGLLQENYLKINDAQQMNFRLWYQNSDRNLPPAIKQSKSVENIKNEFYRATAEWQKAGSRANYVARVAYFNEGLVYTDAPSDIDSKHRSHSVITEVESKIHISPGQLLNAGINNTYSQAASTGYLNNPAQNRTSFFGSYKLLNKKDTWKGVISIREEIINGKTSPVTPSAGFEGLIIKNISIKGNVSRNYSVPTFNDLYWNPGGNPDLVPESGWSEELGAAYRGTRKNTGAEMNVTVFNSRIKNWITWLPDENKIWSPENIMEVWSRGAETSFKLFCKIKEVTLQLSGKTSYVVSTNEKTKSETDASLHRQLIYVPMYKGFGNFSIGYRNFYFNYNHHYTGYRYTSSDNTEYLEPYQLSNISVSNTLQIKKTGIRIYAQVNNVFNKVYQVMLGRAMPLRNYQLGTSLQFNKPNN